ncbi:hypothetical protein FB597_105185 [Herbaspirillum sp. SJZ099]|nr:hypothetical protein FB597_105185 [Herbaspirillum sp. SJZ099]
MTPLSSVGTSPVESIFMRGADEPPTLLGQQFIGAGSSSRSAEIQASKPGVLRLFDTVRDEAVAALFDSAADGGKARQIYDAAYDVARTSVEDIALVLLALRQEGNDSVNCDELGRKLCALMVKDKLGAGSGFIAYRQGNRYDKVQAALAPINRAVQGDKAIYDRFLTSRLEPALRQCLEAGSDGASQNEEQRTLEISTRAAYAVESMSAPSLRKVGSSEADILRGAATRLRVLLYSAELYKFPAAVAAKPPTFADAETNTAAMPRQGIRRGDSYGSDGGTLSDQSDVASEIGEERNGPGVFSQRDSSSKITINWPGDPKFPEQKPSANVSLNVNVNVNVENPVEKKEAGEPVPSQPRDNLAGTGVPPGMENVRHPQGVTADAGDTKAHGPASEAAARLTSSSAGSPPDSSASAAASNSGWDEVVQKYEADHRGEEDNAAGFSKFAREFVRDNPGKLKEISKEFQAVRSGVDVSDEFQRVRDKWESLGGGAPDLKNIAFQGPNGTLKRGASTPHARLSTTNRPVLVGPAFYPTSHEEGANGTGGAEPVPAHSDEIVMQARQDVQGPQVAVVKAENAMGHGAVNEASDTASQTASQERSASLEIPQTSAQPVLPPKAEVPTDAPQEVSSSESMIGSPGVSDSGVSDFAAQQRNARPGDLKAEINKMLDEAESLQRDSALFKAQARSAQPVLPPKAEVPTEAPQEVSSSESMIGTPDLSDFSWQQISARRAGLKEAVNKMLYGEEPSQGISTLDKAQETPAQPDLRQNTEAPTEAPREVLSSESTASFPGALGTSVEQRRTTPASSEELAKKTEVDEPVPAPRRQNSGNTGVSSAMANNFHPQQAVIQALGTETEVAGTYEMLTPLQLSMPLKAQATAVQVDSRPAAEEQVAASSQVPLAESSVGLPYVSGTVEEQRLDKVNLDHQKSFERLDGFLDEGLKETKKIDADLQEMIDEFESLKERTKPVEEEKGSARSDFQPEAEVATAASPKYAEPVPAPRLSPATLSLTQPELLLTGGATMFRNMLPRNLSETSSRLEPPAESLSTRAMATLRASALRQDFSQGSPQFEPRATSSQVSSPREPLDTEPGARGLSGHPLQAGPVPSVSEGRDIVGRDAKTIDGKRPGMPAYVPLSTTNRPIQISPSIRAFEVPAPTFQYDKWKAAVSSTPRGRDGAIGSDAPLPEDANATLEPDQFQSLSPEGYYKLDQGHEMEVREDGSVEWRR